LKRSLDQRGQSAYHVVAGDNRVEDGGERGRGDGPDGVLVKFLCILYN